jgi:hypothetical protein
LAAVMGAGVGSCDWLLWQRKVWSWSVLLIVWQLAWSCSVCCKAP